MRVRVKVVTWVRYLRTLRRTVDHRARTRDHRTYVGRMRWMWPEVAANARFGWQFDLKCHQNPKIIPVALEKLLRWQNVHTLAILGI